MKGYSELFSRICLFLLVVTLSQLQKNGFHVNSNKKMTLLLLNYPSIDGYFEQGDADIIIAVILPEHLPKPIFQTVVREVVDIISMHAFDCGLAGTSLRDSLQGTTVGNLLIEDSFTIQVGSSTA